MPPPAGKPLPLSVPVPPEMVMPEIVAVAAFWKTEKLAAAESRCTVNKAEPGPVIVMLLVIPNPPEVSVIVCGPEPRLTVIVSPSCASAIASRKLPGPLSAVLLTTGPGSLSATSTIVTVALATPRFVPAEGEPKVKLNVSLGPLTLSSRIVTLMVFVTSPGPKVRSSDLAA